ncbi:MAG: histidine phosphatase family protein [Aquabacterium sp.]|nr:histidine phosphatase family protein [Aquabacterium sp.]
MSDQVTRLLVIRHGETPWNTETRVQGHIDIPLNDKGKWQAARMGRALVGEGIDAIYSSDLQRAHHTANALGQAVGVPVQLDARLRERHFGRLEGMTPDEVTAQWPEEAARWRQRDPSYGPQGGEPLQLFHDRCVEAITHLASQHLGQTIAVVAHGGVLDCFYREANGVPVEVPRSWTIGNASINRLLYTPQGLRMLAWADTRHLEDDLILDEATDGQLARA